MSSTDRREAPRYAPAPDADGALVGWWDAGQFLSLPAQVRDLSTGGAAVSVGAAEAPRMLWMCVARGAESGWICARLVDSAETESGARRVRLAFDEPCSYEIFKAVVWGHAAPAGPPPATALALVAADAPAGGSDATVPAVMTRLVLTAPGDDFSPARLFAPPAQLVGQTSPPSAFPWVMSSVLALALAALLAVTAVERLDALRVLQAALGGAADRR